MHDLSAFCRRASYCAAIALGASAALLPAVRQAHALTISAHVAAAYDNPATVDHTLDLKNGDFLIHANPSPSAGPTGDGVDEQTTWSFDFKNDPNYSAFVAGGTLTSAKLTITLNTAFFVGGVAPITDGLFPADGVTGVFPEYVVPSFLTRGPGDPPYKKGSITVDLIKDVGEKSSDLFDWLTSHSGLFPTVYADDAIVTAATLVLWDSDAIPEPASLLLLATGLGTAAGALRQRERRRA
jgi:hypothetical protein